MGVRGWDSTGFATDEDEEEEPKRPASADAPSIASPSSEPTAPVVAEPASAQPIPDAQRIVMDLADQWRRLEGRDPLPRPIGPPPSPAGHAPLPSLAEQRAALGLAPSQTSPSVVGAVQDPPALPRPVVQDPAFYATAIGIVASPDASPAIERREPGPVLSVEGHEVILPLDAVLSDSRLNYTRCGVAWQLNDPKVVDQADTIETFGLKNPIGVRKLDPPIERDVPVTVTIPGPSGEERVLVTHYTHQVVDGFKRFAALQLLKRVVGRFTELEINQQIAVLHNGIENVDRAELTEYQLAYYAMDLAKMTGWTAEEIASVIKAKPARVEQLMTIVARLPQDLLDVFRCSPTPEIRRDMHRIAQIERETPEETHQAMLDEWLRLDEQRRTVVEQKGEEKKRDAVLDGGGERARRSMNRAAVERFRAGARHATEWYDAMSGRWRPIDDEARAYADALLRHVCDPKGARVLR